MFCLVLVWSRVVLSTVPSAERRPNSRQRSAARGRRVVLSDFTWLFVTAAQMLCADLFFGCHAYKQKEMFLIVRPWVLDSEILVRTKVLFWTCDQAVPCDKIAKINPHLCWNFVLSYAVWSRQSPQSMSGKQIPSVVVEVLVLIPCLRMFPNLTLSHPCFRTTCILSRRNGHVRLLSWHLL